MEQAFIWTNADLIRSHIYAALGGDELTAIIKYSFWLAKPAQLPITEVTLESASYFIFFDNVLWCCTLEDHGKLTDIHGICIYPQAKREREEKAQK